MLVEDADDAHVDGDLRMGAQTAHALFLDDAQQLGLQAKGHGVEFVEEQGAAVGLFEQAGLVRGVGVGPLDGTEQDAFQQVLGDGGAVDRDERMPGAAAGRVDGLGEQFLAGAALAPDHDRRGAGGRGAGLVDAFLQGLVPAHDAGEGIVVVGRVRVAGLEGAARLRDVGGVARPDGEGDDAVLAPVVEQGKEVRHRAGQEVGGGGVPVGFFEQGLAGLEAFYGGDDLQLVGDVEAGDVLSFHGDAGETVGTALDGVHVLADAVGIDHGHTDAHIVPDGPDLRRQYRGPVDVVELAAVEHAFPPG